MNTQTSQSRRLTHYPVCDTMDQAQIIEALDKWRSTNDVRYRDKILAAYQGVVVQIANRLHRQGHLTKEDLVQEGFIALLYAVNRYDPSRGTKFMSYAWACIQGYMYVAINRAVLIRYTMSNERQKIFWKLPGLLSMMDNHHDKANVRETFAKQHDVALKDIEYMEEWYTNTCVTSEIENVSRDKPSNIENSLQSEDLYKIAKKAWYTNNCVRKVDVYWDVYASIAKGATRKDICAKYGYTRESIRQILLRVTAHIEKTISKEQEPPFVSTDRQ